ncbi:hypothetical protein PIB30_106041, partial [Stylosanthes scabra]|nr:hypothetical protein [Stylosanthes scabra]
MVRNSHLNFATLELSTQAHLGNYNFRRRYSSSISSTRSKSGKNGQTVAEQRTVAKNRKPSKHTYIGDEPIATKARVHKTHKHAINHQKHIAKAFHTFLSETGIAERR